MLLQIQQQIGGLQSQHLPVEDPEDHGRDQLEADLDGDDVGDPGEGVEDGLAGLCLVKTAWTVRSKRRISFLETDRSQNKHNQRNSNSALCSPP